MVVLSSDEVEQSSRTLTDTATTRTLNEYDTESTPLLTPSTRRRQLGFTAVTFLIFNRVVGAGIFVTPGLILHSAGSIGASFVLWLVGAAYAAAGTAVYIELGTAIPLSGGEKVYLSATWTRPRYLIPSAYAAYALLVGWCAANSVICAEYLLLAADIPGNHWNVRVLATLLLTSIAVLHGVSVTWGVRVQNAFGSFKVLALGAVGIAGIAILGGWSKVPLARENFKKPFEGTNTSPNAVVTGLFKVVWSFIGYANANAALGEVKNPVRTIKQAAPLALAAVIVLYLSVNLAYFAAVPKEDISRSGTTIAALFFRLVLGRMAEKVLSVLIAFSAYGTVLSVIFSHARINQAVAADGIVPFARQLVATSKFGTPLNAIILHYVVSLVIIVAAPPGDAYNMIINVISYPLVVANLFIALGLLNLRSQVDSKGEPKWNPPYRASTAVIVFFGLGNAFLTFAPFIPPAPGAQPYKTLPYWLHVVIGMAIFGAGILYWLAWRVVLPRLGGYRWIEQSRVQADGQRITTFVKQRL